MFDFEELEDRAPPPPRNTHAGTAEAHRDTREVRPLPAPSAARRSPSAEREELLQRLKRSALAEEREAQERAERAERAERERVAREAAVIAAQAEASGGGRVREGGDDVCTLSAAEADQCPLADLTGHDPPATADLSEAHAALLERLREAALDFQREREREQEHEDLQRTSQSATRETPGCDQHPATFPAPRTRKTGESREPTRKQRTPLPQQWGPVPPWPGPPNEEVHVRAQLNNVGATSAASAGYVDNLDKCSEEDADPELERPSSPPPASPPRKPEEEEPAPPPWALQREWPPETVLFDVLGSVLPMHVQRPRPAPQEVMGAWESWGVVHARRLRFSASPGALNKWLNPREDLLPPPPEVTKLDGKASILQAVQLALTQRDDEAQRRAEAASERRRRVTHGGRWNRPVEKFRWEAPQREGAAVRPAYTGQIWPPTV